MLMSFHYYKMEAFICTNGITNSERSSTGIEARETEENVYLDRDSKRRLQRS